MIKRAVFLVLVWGDFLIGSYQLVQEDEHGSASYRRPEELFCWGVWGGLHHEGPAVAPVVVEGPASESQGSDLGLELPMKSTSAQGINLVVLQIP